MNIDIPHVCEFYSSRDPLHKIQYTHLSPGAPHTLFLCYGAGGRAIDSLLYSRFIDSHPELGLLCVDRWTLSSTASSPQSTVARDGPALLSELTSITIELLDTLHISTFSIAAHSAGAYQMLDLVRSGRVRNIFPICTHIPAPLLSSTALTCLSKAPDFAFNGITRWDTSWMDSAILRLYRRFFPTQESELGDRYPYVDGTNLRNLLASYQSTLEQRTLTEERHRLDYRFIYARLPGITAEALVQLYMALKNWPEVRVVWFTCDGDAFFGPSSVRRVTDLWGDDREVEVVVVPEASHADIFRRITVWDYMYKCIVDGGNEHI